MLPKYSTVLFTDIWNSYDEFITDFTASPFKDSITQTEILYYLLYARYGNNPIANNDIEQWKFKIYGIIFAYGPTWEKKLDLQEKIRNLTEDELRTGTKAVHNTALNPSTQPSTSALDELNYINSQNTTNYKKNKIDAYLDQFGLLDDSITEDFIVKFRKCFKQFVAPERPLLYVEDYDEE